MSSYSFFVSLGLVAAIALYYYNVRSRGLGSAGLTVALAAVIGGIIGAKLPIWLVNIREIVTDPTAALVLSGRTIIGGIIGGAVAVWLTKKRMGITARLGNYLVPSLCLGILLGRVGCLLAGCCYGKVTSLPWGMDFGDGMLRHPTQLYEALFVLAFLIYAQVTLDRHESGVLFRGFVIAYFGWRFLVEFIRVNPASAVGLTYYQITAAVVMLYYLGRMVLAGSLGGAARE